MTNEEREDLLTEGGTLMHDLWPTLNEIMNDYHSPGTERSPTATLDIQAAVALYKRHVYEVLEDHRRLVTRLDEAFEALEEGLKQV